MSGEELKRKILESGITIAQLARDLGYNNPQRLHSELNAQDVKSGLIESISKILDKNILYFYEEKSEDIDNRGAAISFDNNGFAVNGYQNNISHISSEIIDLLQASNEQLKAKDEQINRLLSLLEKMN